MIIDGHAHFPRDDTRLKSFVASREAVGQFGRNKELSAKEQTIEDRKYCNYDKETHMGSDTKIALLSNSPSDGPEDWFIRREQVFKTRESGASSFSDGHPSQKSNPLASTPEQGHGASVPGTRRGRVAGDQPAAEGATGPRKRSGTKDRDGQGSLESRTARKRGVRTDGVRGHTPESLRYRDRGGSSLPAFRRWMALSRRTL